MEKIDAALAETDWDGLVVLGPENVQYLSGAWIPYARAYLDRPNIVVWPREGEPTFVTGAELRAGIEPRSFITRFVGYEEKGALPPAVIVDTVAGVLRESGLAQSRIGLEMLRTSVLFYERLQELLPEARFESADALLRRLRQVKTPAEIERMREGARLTDDGVWKAFNSVSAGASERDLGASIQLNVLGNGCSAVTTLLVGTGEGARVLGPPTDRNMTQGDIVRIDLNSIYDGYFSDMGRMAVVGEPNTEQKKAYRDQIELKERIFEFMRPGRTCSEIHGFYLEQANKMNVELFIYPYIGLGHGIGVNGDEYPKLNAADETPIEPGMILNVEPDTIGPKGEIFHVEDMVLVTEQGIEPISHSRDWSDIPVIEL
jgi:Xaa-Pro aminopeptidase